MQNVKTTETASKVVFDAILETHPGGGVVAIADLVEDVLYAGTPVGKDANGLWHVVKTAIAQASATNSATEYKFEKGHNFKVGNIVTTALLKKAYAITAIDTSNASYDLVTVGTTLGVAVSEHDIFLEATAEATGNTSAYKYTPLGLVGEDHDVVTGGNLVASIVVRGSAREDSIQYAGIHSDIKSTLAGLVRFV